MIEYLADPQLSIREKGRTLLLALLIVAGLIALVFAVVTLVVWLAPSDEVAGRVFAVLWLALVFGPLVVARRKRRRGERSASRSEER